MDQVGGTYRESFAHASRAIVESFQIPDHRILAFYEYWDSKISDNRPPLRSNIDPIEIPQFLTGIVLYEVMEGGDRFRFKLWGTLLTQIYGYDCTGKFADEVFEDSRSADIHRVLRGVAETQQPHYWEIDTPVENRTFMKYRRIALPLWTNADRVELLIGFHTALPRQISLG
ncbi:MAG: PAS domain-containing protein [Pseudomonadota bacterium]